jgi:hypothetical protein
LARNDFAGQSVARYWRFSKDIVEAALAGLAEIFTHLPILHPLTGIAMIVTGVRAARAGPGLIWVRLAALETGAKLSVGGMA